MTSPMHFELFSLFVCFSSVIDVRPSSKHSSNTGFFNEKATLLYLTQYLPVSLHSILEKTLNSGSIFSCNTGTGVPLKIG
jgi:hypothetical protein